MEKVVIGQKVVRTAKDQEPGFFNAKCRAAGVDPKGTFTVTAVSRSGKWFGIDGLAVEGDDHPWNRMNFEAFVEPVEASPVTFVKREPIPTTIGCVVIRKPDCMTSEWVEICKKNGASTYDSFTVENREHNRFLTLRNKRGAVLNWMFAENFEIYDQEQITKADADGWIEWHGGECPVDEDIRVDYKLRDTIEYFKNVAAGDLVWSDRKSESDIVAYRPHVKTHTVEQKLRRRLNVLEDGYNEEINKRINAEREAAEKIAKLESQLTDERQHRMKQESLIERLRKILSTNGKEYKNAIEDRDTFRQLHAIENREASRLAGLLKSNDKIIQAMDVVVEQSRDNVKLALVLAASPEISGDAVESLARLVRLDQNQQTNKIIGMISDRGVEQLPF